MNGLNMLFLPRNTKSRTPGWNQTWYRGATPGVDELIRFWARSAQRQRSKVNEIGLNMTSLTRNLKNPWVDFHKIQGATLGVDELIRFWARSAQRQRSKVNEIYATCKHKISRTRWWIFIKLGTGVRHQE